MGVKEQTGPKGTSTDTKPSGGQPSGGQPSGGQPSGATSWKDTSWKEFLAELKEAFDKDIAWRDALDNKADKMITLSSAIATLLITIGTFLVSRIQPTSWLYYADVFILLGGIILAASAIGLFIYSFRVRDFYFPIGPADIYFPDVIKCPRKHIIGKRSVAGEGKICEQDLIPENINNYLDVDQVKYDWERPNSNFAEHAINQYIKMMKLNSYVLLSKANILSKGQWLFLASILSVSLVLLMTLIGISSGIAFVEQTKSVGNELPISNAGSDEVTVENKTVILDGSESRDRDGAITSYFWNQTSGYKVDILNNNDITAAFMAPNVTNATQLEFKLTVKDNKNATSDDIVRVIVKNNTLQDSSNPIICAGVVPYGTSYQDSNAHFQEVVDNNSKISRLPFGCGVTKRLGDFSNSPPLIFVHAMGK